MKIYNHFSSNFFELLLKKDSYPLFKQKIVPLYACIDIRNTLNRYSNIRVEDKTFNVEEHNTDRFQEIFRKRSDVYSISYVENFKNIMDFFYCFSNMNSSGSYTYKYLKGPVRIYTYNGMIMSAENEILVAVGVKMPKDLRDTIEERRREVIDDKSIISFEETEKLVIDKRNNSLKKKNLILYLSKKLLSPKYANLLKKFTENFIKEDLMLSETSIVYLSSQEIEETLYNTVQKSLNIENSYEFLQHVKKIDNVLSYL